MLYISSLLTLFSLLFNTSYNDSLEINVDNVIPSKGAIYLSVYENDETFCSEETFVFANIYPVNSTRSLHIKISDLPYGNYAVAIYQDVNDNRKMDKNLMGVPKEPFAFSNGATAKWSEPEFDDAKFTFNADSQPQKIVLKYWKNQ